MCAAGSGKGVELPIRDCAAVACARSASAVVIGVPAVTAGSAGSSTAHACRTTARAAAITVRALITMRALGSAAATVAAARPSARIPTVGATTAA